MTDIAIPAGDNTKEGEEEAKSTPVQAEPDKTSADTGIKSTCCQRACIRVLIAAVVVIAIIGVVVAIVPEMRRRKRISSNSKKVYETASITENPFVVNASLFSTNNTEPYISIEEVEKDMIELTKVFCNDVILSQVNDYRYNNDDMMYAGAVMESDIMTTSAADLSGTTTAKSQSDSAFADTSDFSTYQHEAGVVKNDLVKSNGVHVFATSTNRILVWDLEGNVKETISIESDNESDDDWSYSPAIGALLMNPEGTKLIAIVNDPDYSYNFNRKDYSIVDNYGATRVIVYAIDGSSLTKISESRINGSYTDSYMVGNNVHIVTKMKLELWPFLQEPLNRFNIDPNYRLTDEEFVATATDIAEEIMPRFVEELMDFVVEGEDILLSRFTGFPGSTAEYSTLNQVTSFDISTFDSDNDIAMKSSKSLVLGPGNTGFVYATDGWIWVSDQTGIRNLLSSEYLEQTMLLGFRLDGASSTFAAVGTVPGSLLNQFAIDFVEDSDNAKEYVRVATTQNFGSRGWWDRRPIMPVDTWENGDVTQEEPESRTKNQVVIFEVPKVEGIDNKISELIELGSVEVGKKDETITAVRFFDNLSYVVTFERTDPFYVLELSDPKDPKVLGELKVPGFSEFMHPITEDNSMLITVGKDADEDGRITGFQISVFNSTVPTEPVLVDRLVLENNRESWSGSSASWDERAFRYIQVGELGRLIIPVEVYFNGWDKFGNSLGDDFGGFMVFGVDLTETENMLTHEIEINHILQEEREWDLKPQCYCGYHHTYLPERSMVFDGKLMTMKNEKVISTNLATGETIWNLTFPEELDVSCCDFGV